MEKLERLLCNIKKIKIIRDVMDLTQYGIAYSQVYYYKIKSKIDKVKNKIKEYKKRG